MRKPRTKSLGTAALALAMAALAAGCGEKSEDVTPGTPQPFDVALDFYVNADHAGLYEAIDRGYFRDAGLDVRPQIPSDPSAPIKQVATGRVDLAISYEPEVLLARDQGLPVKAVAAVVGTPLTSLIWLKGSGIGEIKDLRGKTVATAGIPYQSDYLRTILEGAGVSAGSVNEVNVGLNLLPALLGGKAQAILGGFSNIEGVVLTERGEDPTVVPVDQLGVPSYDELVLVAQGSRVEDDPDSIRLFISALANGTRDAIANPEAATESILKAGKGLDPKLTRAEVDATLPLLAAAPGKSFGQMDGANWELFASWMADRGLISDVPEATEVLTNELLPPPPPD